MKRVVSISLLFFFFFFDDLQKWPGLDIHVSVSFETGMGQIEESETITIQ